MTTLKEILSFIADIVGLVGFYLAILTYRNTKKIKSIDDWVSFRVEKDTTLAEFREKLNRIREYNEINSETEIASCLKTMRAVLGTVNKLKQYCIWNDEANKVFSDICLHESQITQIETFDKPYTEQELKGISNVIKAFVSHLAIVITVVEKQE